MKNTLLIILFTLLFLGCTSNDVELKSELEKEQLFILLIIEADDDLPKFLTTSGNNSSYSPMLGYINKNIKDLTKENTFEAYSESDIKGIINKLESLLIKIQKVTGKNNQAKEIELNLKKLIHSLKNKK